MTVLEMSSFVIGAPGGRIVVGDHVRLGRMVSIHASTSVELGAYVSSSDGATIVDCWGPGTDVPRGLEPRPVRVESGAYLGAGSVVGPGVTVGAGAYVGEGAVVLADVPPGAVVFGNPAEVVAIGPGGVT